MMSELAGAVGFGLLSALTLWIGWRRRFFSFARYDHWAFPIRWYHVAAVFAIYFCVVTLGSRCIALLFRQMGPPPSTINGASWLNFLSSSLLCMGIGTYILCLPREIPKKIWRRDRESAYLLDCQFAAIAWFISFPLVIFLNQLLDLFLHVAFHLRELPDQLAVHFLKMTFQDPLNFFLTVITIVVFAPIIEETLFRGFLQSFIRQHLGQKQAIFITALCFSCFHYSPEQGLANISIIGSLFALALFLGFVYDRRGSLAASMMLHAAFNAINVLNLYFLGGFPKNLSQ